MTRAHFCEWYPAKFCSEDKIVYFMFKKLYEIGPTMSLWRLKQITFPHFHKDKKGTRLQINICGEMTVKLHLHKSSETR